MADTYIDVGGKRVKLVDNSDGTYSAAGKVVDGKLSVKAPDIEELLGQILTAIEEGGSTVDLTELLARIGEVQASPTANTVLARLKDLLTELQAQEYGTSQPITQTLAPNTDTLFTMADECAYFDLINEGPSDVYVMVDGVAQIGGAGCLKLLAEMAYTLRQRGTVVHIIGPSASVVQVVGVR